MMASIGIRQVPWPSSSKLAAFNKLSSTSSFHYRYQQEWLRRRCGDGGQQLKRSSGRVVVVAASGSSSTSRWDGWWKPPPPTPLPGKGGVFASSPSLSDVLWPSAGAFAAMALLGRLDQMMASKGISFTIAPLGAVCAVLFVTPTSPAAKKHNMFIAHIVCAAFGVLALSVFGPGWLARSISLAACVAFMIATGATHPPAASLPILFIDGAKFQQLQFWYMLFPGATGCILLCLIQEMVFFLKSNFKF